MLFLSAPVAAQSTRAVPHYVEGARAYHVGNEKRTLTAFEAGLRLDPGNSEARDVAARVYHEFAFKAHRGKDPVRAAQLLTRAVALATDGPLRVSLQRDLLRMSYLRIVQRIKEGDLFQARRDEDALFEKAREVLATSDSVYLVIRRLHEYIVALPEPADIFADERTEDVQVVLDGMEWRASPAVFVAMARFALLGNAYMLARAFVDEARRADRDQAFEANIAPLDKAVRIRSVPFIVQGNTTAFRVILDNTEGEVRWRGTYDAKEGEREVRVAIVPGQYRMRCVKPGHEGLTQVIQVPWGSGGIEERCLLAAEERAIIIESPVAGERVRIDGVTDAFTEVPFSVSLKPGDYLALVERPRGNDIEILRIPFTVRGDEDRVVLNTTYGQVKLQCLGIPCSRTDFRVQSFEEGWLGAEQFLIEREKDTYLLPYGTYRVTLVKKGYDREDRTVQVGFADQEPVIFTPKVSSRSDAEALVADRGSEEAALPSLFRFRNRISAGAAVRSERQRFAIPSDRTVERRVERLDVTLDYEHRFALSGRRIPFVFFDGRFGMQAWDESQTLADLRSFEATVGAGLIQRFRGNVHAVLSGGYYLRYDQWAPYNEHLGSLGLDLRGLIDLAWFRQRMAVRFVHGWGEVQLPQSTRISGLQSQAFHLRAETSVDLVEAITGDPRVDLYVGLSYGGDYVRERREDDARLSTYDRLHTALFAHFEWRFDIGEGARFHLGTAAQFHFLGPYSPELFLASQDKLDSLMAEARSWGVHVFTGAQF